MSTEYIYITVRPPRSGFPGAIREGWFVLVDGGVRLADRDGIPLPGARNTAAVNPDETPRQAAIRLLKKQSTHGPSSAFNRQLRYPRSGRI